MTQVQDPTDYRIKVLLVDDQAMIGEAVRRMVAGEPDITFAFCKDPTLALEEANRFGPTVILQDLVMPEIDGLTLVEQFRANEATRDTPMIVLSGQEEPRTKAEAFRVGANDYIVKLPDKLELLARIRYHSRGYINLLQRNEAYRALLARERLLASDVAQAARYVTSILPRPLRTGPVLADWRFFPSATLGGDTFGYHWLDDDHFALFLLDASGHGVGPALLAVSALNALRSQSLPSTDFRDPSQVLAALNRAFPMEQQNNLFFTIWYGVYHKAERRLDYAGGGHPPALLIVDDGPVPGRVRQLDSAGPMIGAFDAIEFPASRVAVPPGARLFLYSDGVFEIERADRSMWPFADFVSFLGQPSPPDVPAMDRLIQECRDQSGRESFVDDFSVVEFRFEPVA